MANNNKTYSIEEAIKSLGKELKDYGDTVIAKAKAAVPILAAQAHGIIVQKATEKLKSRRTQYLDALEIKKIEDSSDNEIWTVTLNASAAWIEDGMAAGERIDMILNGGKAPKISKEGHRYKVIPFQHNKPPSQMSAAQNKLANYVKTQLKKQNLDKVINDEAGNPKLGRVASVKITDPKQPISKFNQPLLNGLTIYQREHKTQSGNIKIKRSVMTFRVISDAQKGSGLWQWNEQKGVKIFEEAEKEMDVIFKQMLDDILK